MSRGTLLDLPLEALFGRVSYLRTASPGDVY